MKGLIRKVMSAALAAAVTAACMPVALSAAADDAFDDLSAEEITEAMGVGWNLGNQLEANSNKTPNETAWGNPVISQQTLDMVKNAGFDTVRIPVSYLSMIGDAESGYKISEEWLDRVQEVVDYAMNDELFVIINMHGDGYYSIDGGWLLCADDNQEEIREKYKACWAQIAERFKDYDEHLIFESMNEEFDNTYNNPNRDYYANINAYNQIFVDTVRAAGGNNEKRWVLMPGWNTNIDYTVGDYGFEIPTDEGCTADGNRIMISVHYYDPWDFCGDEGKTNITQWGSNAEKGKFARYGQPIYAEGQFQKLYDSFVSKGYPVVVGEMGCIDKSAHDELNPSFRAEWLSTIVGFAKDKGCVPVYWDNGWNGDNGFGLFDRTTFEPTQPDLILAMIPDSPVTSGSGGETEGDGDDTADDNAQTSQGADPDEEQDNAAESVDNADNADSAADTDSAAQSVSSADSADDSTAETGSPVVPIAIGGAAVVIAAAAVVVLKKRK